MGFYSTKTSEEKRVTQLTGDVHLREEFKEEIENRGIPMLTTFFLVSIHKLIIYN